MDTARDEPPKYDTVNSPYWSEPNHHWLRIPVGTLHVQIYCFSLILSKILDYTRPYAILYLRVLLQSGRPSRYQKNTPWVYSPSSLTPI